MNEPSFLSVCHRDLWGTPSWQTDDHIHTAILLAASRHDADPLLASTGATSKAAIPVNGRAMIDYVLAALKDARNIGHIVIVCDEGPLADWAFDADYPPGVSVVRSKPSISESVLAAIDASPQGWPFLVTTADHPLLTAAIVDGFCHLAATVEGDLSVGLARRRLVEEVYPQVKRTFLPFRDTEVSGCNLFALKNPATLSAIHFWRNAEQRRKKPWRLFRAFVLPALIALRLNRLTLIEAFARVSQVVGTHVTPILLPWPEAAIDVDGQDDLHLVADVLATRNAEQIPRWERVPTF